jgi:phosphate transport system substrate-binding protein
MRADAVEGDREMVRRVTAALVVAGIAWATSVAAEKITVTGSDTMLPLAERWAAAYMAAHPDVDIQVSGGGSSTGIAALFARTADIANSGRAIRPVETKAARSAGIEAAEFKVAMSALAVAVHEDNPIAALTMNQLKAIYTGAINNWRDLGGANQGIVRYGRQPNTATYDFFQEHALGNREFAPDCRAMPGPAAIDSAVTADPAAIGYGATAYFLNQEGIKVLKLKQSKDAPAIAPVTADGKSLDLAVIHAGTYPLTRTLYCYTAGKPAGAVAAYLDWITGPEGQRIAAEIGFAPLPAGARAGEPR